MRGLIVTFYDFAISPFIEFAFMKRALIACLGLALGCAPIGVFLVLRRMSLMGDALSHAILPGAAIGYTLFGLSLGAMTIGGFAAGIAVALLAGVVTRFTPLREDASFAAFYLISLVAGVLLISARGPSIDLMNVLFGSVLAVDDAGLLLIGGVTSITLCALALIFRPLVAEMLDPDFLRTVDGRGGLYHGIFLVLTVLNLVAAFQALGTLMAVGLMMLPAAAARFWAGSVGRIAIYAAGIALLAAWTGLVLSFHWELPTGPAIVLAAGILYVISVLCGPVGGIIRRRRRHRHLEA